MTGLERLLRRGGAVRTVGFDDAPFQRAGRRPVSVAGIVCAGTRFEGMVWTAVRKDGWNATDALIAALRGGKFLPQLHVVLLDGIAFGGFNVVDLSRLSEVLERPCVAVTRRHPDMRRVRAAIDRLPRPAERWRLIERAGPFYERAPFCFQVRGAEPDLVEAVLRQATDRGHVPEALRLAHLVGSAVATGQSGNRA